MENKKINFNAIKDYITERAVKINKGYVFDPSKVMIYFSVLNSLSMVHKEEVFMTDLDACEKLMDKFNDWCERMSKEPDKYKYVTMDVRWYEVVPITYPVYVWNEGTYMTNTYDIIASRSCDDVTFNDKWIVNEDKLYEVSAPMFVLPSIKVIAKSKEEAMGKYQLMAETLIEDTFNKVDVRPLYDRDESDAWVVTEINDD